MSIKVWHFSVSPSHWHKLSRKTPALSPTVCSVSSLVDIRLCLVFLFKDWFIALKCTNVYMNFSVKLFRYQFTWDFWLNLGNNSSWRRNNIYVYSSEKVNITIRKKHCNIRVDALFGYKLSYCLCLVESSVYFSLGECKSSTL